MSQLFDLQPDASKKRKVQIAEGAIAAFSKYGPDGLNHGNTASQTGVSRTLVIHYFRTREDLFSFLVRYIRAVFQELAINELQRATTPKEMLIRYVGSTFVWVKQYEPHAKVWLYFLSRCSSEEQYRVFHTQVVSMGKDRIRELLEIGRKEKLFTFSDTFDVASMIQIIITGALVALGTEKLKITTDELESQTVSLVLSLVGYKS